MKVCHRDTLFLLKYIRFCGIYKFYIFKEILKMKTKKILAMTAAAIMIVSAIPTVCYAENSVWTKSTVQVKSMNVDFAILGYKEKNGELTITSCYDYDPMFSCNGGYIAVCVFNGELTIPAFIDEKPVIGIKSLSGNTHISKLIIPESVAEISETAYNGCTLSVETTDDELKLRTLYV